MASDINRVIIIGRLTRDSELSYTASGTPMGKISIASNRSVKKGDSWEDETSFFDAVMWGKRAESLNQYLRKGTQVCIEGELKQDRWEKDGVKRSLVKINAQNIQLLSGKSHDNNSGNTQQTTKPAFATGGSFEDDIPF